MHCLKRIFARNARRAASKQCASDIVADFIQSKTAPTPQSAKDKFWSAVRLDAAGILAGAAASSAMADDLTKELLERLEDADIAVRDAAIEGLEIALNAAPSLARTIQQGVSDYYFDGLGGGTAIFLHGNAAYRTLRTAADILGAPPARWYDADAIAQRVAQRRFSKAAAELGCVVDEGTQGPSQYN